MHLFYLFFVWAELIFLTLPFYFSFLTVLLVFFTIFKKYIFVVIFACLYVLFFTRNILPQEVDKSLENKKIALSGIVNSDVIQKNMSTNISCRQTGSLSLLVITERKIELK